MNTAANAGEVFPDDNDDDEEMDEEARERHREFERKRGMHYSKEAAFAMRKAAELSDDEEEGDLEGMNGGEEANEIRLNGD